LRWLLPVPELNISGSGYINVEDEEFILTSIPKDLTGKSVLDLASFDGYYSYVASKRGAFPVVAIDNCVGEEIAFGPDNGVIHLENRSFPNKEEHKLATKRLYEKYKILNRCLDNSIYFIPMDVYNIDKIEMNFDIVFCFGLYYHVKDIYGLLEKCYNKCNEMVIVEGHVLNKKEALIYIVNPLELHNDCTNFWSPTPSGLIKLLFRVGFKKIDVIGFRGARMLLIAYKKETKDELSTDEN